MALRLITLSIFLSSTLYSQNFMLKDVTNVEKDTIYSTKDISLVSGLVLDHFENGMIKLYGEYKNGLKNGEFKKWHSNGQLKRILNSSRETCWDKEGNVIECD